MLPLDERAIRASFINASTRERKELTLPDLAAIDFDQRDFLGWRDPRLPALGYVITRLDDEPVGLMLRQAERRPGARAQCSWCEDVRLPNDVVLFTAKKAGPAGRKGDTVGILACDGFQCSTNVRKPPPVAYLGFDVEAERQRRIAALGVHVRAFARAVRDEP